MKGTGTNRSFLVTTVLVGGPVILLLAVGFAGLSSLRKAVLADARAEAQERTEQLAIHVMEDKEPGESVTWTRPVRLPLPPASESTDAAAFSKAIETSDVGALSVLAREATGRSEAGLPVRALASIRLLRIHGEIDNTPVIDLWPVVHPSMLSELWLEELEKVASRHPADEKLAFLARNARFLWERDEKIRRAFWDPRREVWSDDIQNGFHAVDGQVMRVLNAGEDPGGAVQVMTGDEVRIWLEAPPGEGPVPVPEWMQVSIGVAGVWFPGKVESGWRDSPTGADRLAETTSGPFTVAASLGDPDLLFAPTNRIARWMTWMMLVAVASAATGLYLAHRSLRREQRLNDLKSQFVSSVSHELRAPVGSMRLMADALDQGKVGGEKAKEFHRLMSREGARLSAMIENVLDFARIEQGKKTYNLSETDIEALVRETVQLMTPLAGEKDVVIETEVDTPSSPPVVDADAIQQALINLIDNAVKFSPDRETVTVSFREDEKSCSWVLSVSDQGPGIPEASRKIVFERFHRLGNELQRETQGAGIGLSLVKHVADGHGGQVKVVSEKSGTTLEMRIPFSIHGTNSKPVRT